MWFLHFLTIEGIKHVAFHIPLLHAADAGGLLIRCDAIKPCADGRSVVGGIGNIETFKYDALRGQLCNSTDGLAEPSAAH